jgi:hypothetical protein
MIVVYVMPLGKWLSGAFRTGWDRSGEERTFPGPKRTDDEVRRGLDAFGERMERLLAFRPDWDEAGPIRSATIFSLDGFVLPFELARRWAYRIKLPRLCALEPPQIWLPGDFDPAFRFAAPWNPDSEVSVASCGGIHQDLERILHAVEGEERPDLEETAKVAQNLLKAAAAALEHDVPVIVEA